MGYNYNEEPTEARVDRDTYMQTRVDRVAYIQTRAKGKIQEIFALASQGILTH